MGFVHTDLGPRRRWCRINGEYSTGFDRLLRCEA
jgi:hypothetical protein